MPKTNQPEEQRGSGENTFRAEIPKFFARRNWTVFPFQKAAWDAYGKGKHGLINAPTGSGKTYSLLVPIMADIADRKAEGLTAIWISPIRALAKEIKISADRLSTELAPHIRCGIRTGDTPLKEREKMKTHPPHILITTPESLHVLISQKGYREYLSGVSIVVCDEWHELVGSKRGVQVQLALSHMLSFCDGLKIWGISATIGNMDEAADVLLGSQKSADNFVFVHSSRKKEIELISVLPDDMENFPWAGHIGTRLLPKVIPIIESNRSTLIFTNTRSQCEIWYQRLLEVKPELAGLMAMHHSAISDELRGWVEDALHDGRLKAVVCTSSLDLGVDFRPVEAVVQIGGPKGVARFMQRAGRSGHAPGQKSKIYFVPTHALELIEGASLRFAIKSGTVESRTPYIRSFDVLVQYLMTLAISEGFLPDEIYSQITGTHAYASLAPDEWQWLINFLVYGSQSLHAYDEYQKVGFDRTGRIRVANRHIARRHRLSIGTIVSDQAMRIRYLSGKRLGTIEEWFISHLSPGDHFWFAGKSLEFIRIKENDVLVRKSNRTKAKVPSWQGGRMPLSSEMSEVMRLKVDRYDRGIRVDPELKALQPILDLQKEKSILPSRDHFLIEYFRTKEGYHLMMYPFEGRFVHEGLASLLAYRISRIQPLTFSIAMNDYGLELLSDQEIPLQEALENGLLASKDLYDDIQRSVNEVEMARRRFRDIASISGLIFQGFPGKLKREKHLQSSSQLLFSVFHDYEPDNLLYLQAYEESKTFQFEEGRLLKALERIRSQEVVITRPDGPTPLSFPILVDRLRERMSSEKLEDRIRKMQIALK